MFNIDFASFPIWINLALFAMAAAVVWFAGGQVAFIGDSIADKTGLGSAFVGVLLLAVATSSPELSTTVTAAWRDNPVLAVNNLLGGIVMQTAILAVVDAVVVRGAMTAFTPRPVLMLQGILLIVLLSLTLAGAVTDLPLTVWHIGLWPVLIFIVYIGVLYLVQRYEESERWQPAPDEIPQAEKEQMQRDEEENQRRSKHASMGLASYQEWSVHRLGLYFAIGTVVILGTGALLALLGDTLAGQSGLGSSFIGITLLATATSLPEVSATIASARIGRLDMAVSNIFGSNAFMLALLVVADLAYRRGAILTAIDKPSLFAAAAGIFVTAVYLAGMMERRDRTIFGMGIDSLAVIGVYVASLVILYVIR